MDDGTVVDGQNPNGTICLCEVPVNGACGSADGGSFSSAPNSNLCDAGNATSVSTSSNTYDWTCQGESGGTNDSCSATRERYEWRISGQYATSPDIDSDEFNFYCGAVERVGSQGQTNLPYQNACTPSSSCDPTNPSNSLPCLLNDRLCNLEGPGGAPDAGNATVWDRYECIRVN